MLGAADSWGGLVGVSGVLPAAIWGRVGFGDRLAGDVWGLAGLGVVFCARCGGLESFGRGLVCLWIGLPPCLSRSGRFCRRVECALTQACATRTAVGCVGKAGCALASACATRTAVGCRKGGDVLAVAFVSGRKLICL